MKWVIGHLRVGDGSVGCAAFQLGEVTVPEPRPVGKPPARATPLVKRPDLATPEPEVATSVPLVNPSKRRRLADRLRSR